MSNDTEYRREYLSRLPLPLAKLYQRAWNAPDARNRHDYSYYLFEVMIKLAVAPAIATYLQEIEQGEPRSLPLDRLLAQLALPSLGQWLAMLRELARRFGERPDASSHPLGHLWGQLSRQRQNLPNLLALYRQIKNGPDGADSGDRSCSLMQVFESIVQYRNEVIGHGGPRHASFFEKRFGPLLSPAATDILTENVFDLLGPPGTRLVFITEARTLENGAIEVGLRELMSTEVERAAPLRLAANDAKNITSNRVALIWPGRTRPLQLHPMLVFRETDLGEEVLFLNRDRNGKQVEYLSYVTGSLGRNPETAAALAALLSRVTGREVTNADLENLAGRSLAESMSVDALFPPVQPTGKILGDYEILGELGRGGMGVVYLARQLSLGRLVALKMLPADLAGDNSALSRFRREIRHLARCEHPNIIKVLSNGEFADGQMYYTMEYVPGSDLEMVWRELVGSALDGSASSLGNTTWSRAVLTASRKRREKADRSRSGIDSGPLSDSGSGSTFRSEQQAEKRESLQENLEKLSVELPPLPGLPDAADDPGGYVRRVVALIRDTALGLQAVHDQGIVHRDIKPANLMLTPDSSRIVLMDFGLAKGQTLSMATSRGSGLLGTLRYAAPEQLASATLKVGPAADIRGLGATLWELLTRKRLFDEAEDERQLAQMIHDEDVPRLREIDAAFDRDLEAIVARATERRASDRIPTATQFAAYLQLYLDGQPLPIRPPGTSELVARWVSGHRGLVVSALAITTAAIIGTIAAFISIAAAKNDAVVAKNDAVVARHLAESQGKELEKVNGSLEEQLYAAHITLAERELALGNDVSRADELLESCPKRLRGWEWRYLMRLRDGAMPPLSAHTRGLWMADFSPDGKQVATVSIDGTLKVWDAANGALIHDIKADPEPEISVLPFGLFKSSASKILETLGAPRMPIMCVAYSPDGKFIATGSFAPTLPLRKSPGVVTIWDSATGRQVLQFKNQLGVVLSLAYSHDGSRIASSSINDENTFVVWESRSGKVIDVLKGHTGQVYRLCYSPDGKLLASGDINGQVKLWDAATLRHVRDIQAHGAPLMSISFEPNGRRFATAAQDGNIHIWNVDSGQRAHAIAAHTGSALGVAYSHDGKLLASSGFDKTVRIWDAVTFQDKITLRGHKEPVWSVAFSPDDQRLVSSSYDNTAQIWDTTPRPVQPRPGIFTAAGHTDRVNSVAFSPDGRWLASGSWDNDIRLYNATSGAGIKVFKGHRAAVWCVAFSPDGKRLASASWDNTVKLWDLVTGAELLTLSKHIAPVHSVAFSRDGKTLASAGFDGQVKLYDSSSGELKTNCDGFIFPIFDVAFSADGKWIATGGTERRVKIWNTKTGQNVLALDGHQAAVHRLAFNGAGNRLVTAGWDNVLKIWAFKASGDSLPKVTLLATSRGHTDRINGVAFSPDDSLVASASEDKTIRIWNSETLLEVRPPLVHRGVVVSVAFSPDQQRLAAGCWSKFSWVRTWPLNVAESSARNDQLRPVAAWQ
ncbi:MAG TPA: protein kinase [Pirellulales bacterium]|jgi:WD40 repeat protein/serine/threonine protein kinase|nr:protein kinase [Pirellulales bacterium]